MLEGITAGDFIVLDLGSGYVKVISVKSDQKKPDMVQLELEASSGSWGQWYFLDGKSEDARQTNGEIGFTPFDIVQVVKEGHLYALDAVIVSTPVDQELLDKFKESISNPSKKRLGVNVHVQKEKIINGCYNFSEKLQLMEFLQRTYQYKSSNEVNNLSQKKLFALIKSI
ncbi:hypothetical protein P255_02975 [Acinetobacter brisouii CIP 110357]|uniref:Uncharacterized protein n=1 Tax=Acinetobacter brisouii CIP 110357 TaxID=1341683 RepID=V2TZV0_9GAMM|nr:hypothetical protein [Acinetobacter brisouii]ENV46192.1 hypothetical protein F954_02827 [Acinetobacter brisouii ANC 4119]ESK47493.1 hypothetical protein P255_02975 [Acinetobacter brisouii CIP 110357]